MRDDLHKTVPVSARWRKVLRCLAQRRTAPEIAQSLLAAVHANDGLQEAVGGRCLREILTDGSHDLFDDGHERMRLRLLQFQDGAVSAQARATCEIAQGILCESGLTPDFGDRVLHAAGDERARNGIDLVSASVAQSHDINTARDTQRRLNAVADTCNFAEEARKPVRRHRKTVSELLAYELSLKS